MNKCLIGLTNAWKGGSVLAPSPRLFERMLRDSAIPGLILPVWLRKTPDLRVPCGCLRCNRFDRTGEKLTHMLPCARIGIWTMAFPLVPLETNLKRQPPKSRDATHAARAECQLSSTSVGKRLHTRGFWRFPWRGSSCQETGTPNKKYQTGEEKTRTSLLRTLGLKREGMCEDSDYVDGLKLNGSTGIRLFRCQVHGTAPVSDARAHAGEKSNAELGERILCLAFIWASPFCRAPFLENQRKATHFGRYGYFETNPFKLQKAISALLRPCCRSCDFAFGRHISLFDTPGLTQARTRTRTRREQGQAQGQRQQQQQ